MQDSYAFYALDPRKTSWERVWRGIPGGMTAFERALFWAGTKTTPAEAVVSLEARSTRSVERIIPRMTCCPLFSYIGAPCGRLGCCLGDSASALNDIALVQILLRHQQNYTAEVFTAAHVAGNRIPRL